MNKQVVVSQCLACSYLVARSLESVWSFNYESAKVGLCQFCPYVVNFPRVVGVSSWWSPVMICCLSYVI